MSSEIPAPRKPRESMSGRALLLRAVALFALAVPGVLVVGFGRSPWYDLDPVEPIGPIVLRWTPVLVTHGAVPLGALLLILAASVELGRRLGRPRT